MIRQKTKKDYLAPHAGVAEADLEGLICQSNLRLGPQVDELKNINSLTGTETMEKAEPLYFEF